MILGVFTQLLGAGGIPNAGRQAAAVLVALAHEWRIDCRILSLNDAGLNKITFAGTEFTVEGFHRSKVRLGAEVLLAASASNIAYFGHCSLAPLGFALKLRSNAAYIIATHGIEVWARLKLLSRLGLRSSATITAPSRFTADKLIETNGISKERLSVVPWGLDPSFHCRPLQNGARPPFPMGRIVLTVARLEASEGYKGIDHVIQAMPELLRLIPNAKYVIVGDGNDRPRLMTLASELGVAEHVFFAGSRSDDEVTFYHAAADIFAMPSSKEGMGLAFLEAMACGKPVVAARAAATPEVVIDQETGFLVDYQDVTGLARHLKFLLSNPELCKRMGDAGQERFKKYYTHDKFHQRLKAIISAQMKY